MHEFIKEQNDFGKSALHFMDPTKPLQQPVIELLKAKMKECDQNRIIECQSSSIKTDLTQWLVQLKELSKQTQQLSTIGVQKKKKPQSINLFQF